MLYVCLYRDYGGIFLQFAGGESWSKEGKEQTKVHSLIHTRFFESGFLLILQQVSCAVDGSRLYPFAGC